MAQTKVNRSGFMMFPRFLMSMKLSDTTKLIYVMLLDRSRLSGEREEFKDEAGRAFVFYTAEQLASDTGRSSRTVQKALAALEREGLIERRRQGFGFASRIFVLLPKDEPESRSPGERTDENEASPAADESVKGGFFSPVSGRNCTDERKNVHPDKRKAFLFGGENISLCDAKNVRTNNNKINNNKNNYNKRERAAPRGQYKNVCLSDEEYRSLKGSYKMADEYIDKLSRYMRMSGKRYACHDAVLRQWLEQDGMKKHVIDYDHWEVESL